jgi:hypothetical protein
MQTDGESNNRSETGDTGFPPQLTKSLHDFHKRFAAEGTTPCARIVICYGK